MHEVSAFLSPNCGRKGAVQTSAIGCLVQFNLVGSRLLGCPFLRNGLLQVLAPMAKILQFQKQYQDTATGCKTTDEAALQTCIQTYYQRQQNQQPSSNLQQENTELKTQVQEIRSELDALKIQPTTTAENAPSQAGINEYGNVIVFALILIITILVTVILTKHFSKK